MLRIGILIAALAAGGGAAWMTLAMRGQPAVAAAAVAPPAPAVAMVDVLVASSNLAVNKKLTKEDMRWQSWPENALNSGYINRSVRADALEALVGSIVHSRMISGEPIQDGNVAHISYTVKLGKVGRIEVVDISASDGQ